MSVLLLLSACAKSPENIENTSVSEKDSNITKVSEAEKIEAENQKKIAEAQKEYEISQVTKPLTKEKYPRIYIEWGDDWMATINKMLRPAVEMVEKENKCDKVISIELSNDRSKLKDTPVFFVTCNNNEKYYVSADQITGDSIEPLVAENDRLIDRQKKTQALFSAWDGSNRELVSYVKKSMRDPSSFEHVETLTRDNGDTVSIQMTYRGKNAFGAIVTERVVADIDPDTRQLININQLD